MNHPNPPQQPGPYGPPPPGGQPSYRPQQPPSYGQQPPPYGQPPMPPGGQQPPPYGQPPTPARGQQPPPYGQPPTPPGGQPPPPPYGQPQSDYPPPADYPPAPTGQPAKPSGKRRVIVAIVAVVVAGGAYLGFQLFNKNSASSADAGDCIKVNRASATSADVEKIDCNDTIAVFKVAKKLGNDTDECPTPDYEKYTQSGSGSDFALCLMLNAKEGECFANFDTPDKRARADCANAEVKVAKLVSGKADQAECQPDSFALIYPEPATTFCLVQPQGS